jgi:hypothetical protein
VCPQECHSVLVDAPWESFCKITLCWSIDWNVWHFRNWPRLLFHINKGSELDRRKELHTKREISEEETETWSIVSHFLPCYWIVHFLQMHIHGVPCTEQAFWVRPTWREQRPPLPSEFAFANVPCSFRMHSLRLRILCFSSSFTSLGANCTKVTLLGLSNVLPQLQFVKCS